MEKKAKPASQRMPAVKLFAHAADIAVLELAVMLSRTVGAQIGNTPHIAKRRYLFLKREGAGYGLRSGREELRALIVERTG